MNQPSAFLPGWGLGRGPWQPTVAALGGEIIDLPGYGDTPLLTDFSAAADAIADRLAPETMLCGWSLGAMLALAVAARHPEKVGKLVLVAGTASFVQRDGWPHAMPPTMLAEFAAAVAADAEGSLLRFIGNFNRGDAQARTITRELMALADPLPGEYALATGLAWLRDVDLRPLAAQVAAPTLLMHGAADPLMPLPAATALAALIPGARLETFAACAHAPFIAAPAAFRDQLAAFRHDATL